MKRVILILVILLLAITLTHGLSQAQRVAQPPAADPAPSPALSPEALNATPTEITPAPAPTPEPTPEPPKRTSIEQKLISISLISARALLYILFLMSILSVMIAVEKFILYRRDNPLGEGFRETLVGLLNADDRAGALKAVEGVRGVNAALIREGLQNFHEGPDAIEEVINGRLILERARLDRRLIILGTIGNNAPFVGLLGTVMGIIKAFHDLSIATTQGPQTVMAGISEALIATAVGLFVAIPAVILYNWLKGKARGLLDEAEANARIVLAYAKRSRGEGNGGQ